jgi:hypothetical protein
VADLPCAGRQVTLVLTVRKFFCPNPSCPRKIFAERFPELVPSYARLTKRLHDALMALGLATSGELTSRLAPQLGMQVAPTTLLRRVRAVRLAPAGKVRVLGVDDWAWKKGQTYGTLLVDLEKHCVIDVLPNREVETVKVWLRSHPEVEVVSRDRAGAYADAARKGAPQAQQVADRFHLLLNLREGLRKFLVRKQKWLPEVEEKRADAIPQKAGGKLQEGAAPETSQELTHEQHFRHMSPTLRKRGSPPTIEAETYSQASRANRYARYEAVRTLHQQGVSLHEIARRFGTARKTVSSSGHSPFPNAVGLPFEGVCLIPTSPTCSSDGSRAVATAHSSMRKSKLLDTRDLLPCSDALSQTCENSIRQPTPQLLSPWMGLRHQGRFLLNFRYHLAVLSACLPPVPPGYACASQQSLTRSNVDTLNRSGRDTVIWIRPINSVKPLSRCWPNVEAGT